MPVYGILYISNHWGAKAYAAGVVFVCQRRSHTRRYAPEKLDLSD